MFNFFMHKNGVTQPGASFCSDLEPTMRLNPRTLKLLSEEESKINFYGT